MILHVSKYHFTSIYNAYVARLIRRECTQYALLYNATNLIILYN